MAPRRNLFCEQVYEPGSVLNSHLSWYIVANVIMRPRQNGTGNPMVLLGPCFRRGLQSLSRCRNSGKLLPYLSTLTRESGRFISVALSLESPPPAVNRHPALRSPDFPHLIIKRDCSAYSPVNLNTKNRPLQGRSY